MKAYGRVGFVGGRRERKRLSSSGATGKRIICSTERLIRMEDRGTMRGDCTHNVNCIGRTGKTFRVVFDDIGCPENTLDRASFDVELVVAEAIFPSNSHPSAACFTCAPALIDAAHLSSGEKFQSVTAP